MKVIPYLHDFIGGLSADVRADIDAVASIRCLAKGEAVYRKDDNPTELYRVLEGAIKLCNYSLEGAQITTGEFRPGDCFGEMGVMDGLPRVSHAIASRDSRLSVLSKQQFETLCEKHPEIHRELNRVLCRRVRYLYSLNDEALGLKLHVRLGRTLHRMAYSHGCENELGETYIEISHEELSNMLGASRQSVSKELKSLERSGDIELRYGKIYVNDLALLAEKYEIAVGMEQFAPLYTTDKD
ncbi:Crp/Fnr family transcriptional regulator [Pseudohalioglobus lutimaris]|uniref:Crp/Fnr family transcriptional regulator n=1 Tax=Pseudohalioglobus lutimaris TaxID=1737061 RepID=A0A2N5X2Y9_9GAMM|nr:Crp/Fnr family transcriptional regulator [Pseudohalioglobus lutimaris]PLW68852.1 Crp/Fnr family transcriptional regulator [Pseudohalioglobus lutimaris]